MPVIPCPDCGREVSTLAPSCPNCGRPSPAGSAPSITPPAPLPAHEETLWRGSPAWTLLIGHVLVMAATLIIVPVVFQMAASRAMDIERAATIAGYGWIITAILLLIEALIFLIALLRLRSTVYTVTNQRVMIETGLLSKAVSEIDLRYIDDSQFSQGVFHRMLGIGNVTLISSDKTTPVYVLRSVRDPRNVRETIRAHAYKVSQRQLFTRAT